MGYSARVVAFSTGLLVLLLAVAIAPRRPVAPARGAGDTPAPAAVAAAPRCSDGSDAVAVVANTPKNDDVPLDAQISATFSCPVDHLSVERAFTIYPAVKGRFEWHDQMLIFQPAEPLQPRTRYRVTFFAGMRDARGFVDARKVSWPFWTR